MKTLRPDNTERNAKIMAMRDDDMGYRAIARALKITPGMVSGVVRRAGMAKPKSTPYRSLTDAQVREIRACPDLSAYALASAFKTQRTTIRRIREGTAYRHVLDV